MLQTLNSSHHRCAFFQVATPRIQHGCGVFVHSNLPTNTTNYGIISKAHNIAANEHRTVQNI